MRRGLGAKLWIPSLALERAGLEVVDIENLRRHYAPTLDAWVERFEQRWDAITAGGAVAGVGIEATSFGQGLVHHTLRELDVLLPDGSIVTCTPDNEHRDLFFGFPNSYGSLGYALRLVLETVPVKPCVRVEHLRFGQADTFFAALEQHCAGDADFIDGVVFDSHALVLNLARFIDEAQAPSLSDYGFERIYYRPLLDTPVDHLAVRDYIWRWDTDWFWCSKNVGAQNPLLRRLVFGRSRLNSRTYTRLMRWNARWGITRRLARLQLSLLGDGP
ncbi:FAD/FMN-containing dehydrogenase [Variovorax soli]|uniref:FAD/FMN-containing dehydrogenase n=1 Tax=Variovorax soli TaxID=376815 RepID=A0ABU1NKW6_9BURK|nr:FAD/FMN-containing dehydrogenase [Variovorax soli]